MKALVDTSAVPAALGRSTRFHNRHFRDAVGVDAELVTSVYVRKEVIDRWVIDHIHMAVTIRLYDDVPDALVRIGQMFSPRSVKGALDVIAGFLRDNGCLQSSARAAEEVASLAVNYLKVFDRVFARRTNSKCGCRIGADVLVVDGNRLIDDLHTFAQRFRTPVENCPVNDFLRLDKGNGLSKRLADDARTTALDVIGNLRKVRDGKGYVNCTGCRTIGDVVIAADQPNYATLVHVDQSFTVLCDVLGKTHLQLQSTVAADKVALAREPDLPPPGPSVA